jgi:curli biogenesis system outer membrane secretion channel CsgG
MTGRASLIVAAAFLLGSGVAQVAEAQKKPVMAVYEFTNHTSAGWWYSGVGNDMADMLTNELAALEKFKMVERKQLGAVLSEQDLARDGRVAKGSAAKAGKLTGAQYLVTGQVSAYEEDVKGTGGGVHIGGIGLGGSKAEAYIAIDLRVVNTTTGEIVRTRTVEARSSSRSIGVSASHGGIGGNFGKMEKTPAGKAIRACLIEASEYLGCVMVDKGGCEDEYAAKDKARREKTKGKVKLE